MRLKVYTPCLHSYALALWPFDILLLLNPYPTAFPYGNGMVLHFYQQQESSTTKTVHKVINKGLKTYVYSLHAFYIFNQQIYFII